MFLQIITYFDRCTVLLTKHFKTYEEIKKWLDEWIALKDKYFFITEFTYSLMEPEKWEKVIGNDGKYILNKI